MKRPVSKKTLAKRDKIIVRAILKDGRTGSSVGQAFGITRERVGQIFYRETGKSIRQVTLERKTEEYKRALKERERFCIHCGAKIRDPRRRKYCTNLCYSERNSQRRSTKIFKCTYCKKEFHPFYTSQYSKSENHFCSHKHFLLWRKKK